MSTHQKPTIEDLTLMPHDHSDDANGGKLDALQTEIDSKAIGIETSIDNKIVAFDGKGGKQLKALDTSTVDISGTNTINFQLGPNFKTTLTATTSFGFANMYENAIAFVYPTGAFTINTPTTEGYTFVEKEDSSADGYVSGKSCLCFKVRTVTTGSDGVIEYFYSNDV